jgi:predicted metal-binding membrane protein
MAGMAPRMGIAAWTAMTAATMLPSTLPVVHHVARDSLRRRRHRAVFLFTLGYLAVWTAFGGFALAVLPQSPSVPIIVLLVAAAWQLTPWQRTALRGCHRTSPLPAATWRADIATLRFGVTNGRYCVGACWCLMLVMCCAPGSPLLSGAAVGAGVFVQKTTERPAHVAQLGALVLLVIALFVAL